MGNLAKFSWQINIIIEFEQVFLVFKRVNSSVELLDGLVLALYFLCYDLIDGFLINNFLF